MCMAQKLLAQRKESAAREATLTQEAAAAAAEAEASSQLVHSLRPPRGGDVTIGVLWSKVSVVPPLGPWCGRS